LPARASSDLKGRGSCHISPPALPCPVAASGGPPAAPVPNQLRPEPTWVHRAVGVVSPPDQAAPPARGASRAAFPFNGLPARTRLRPGLTPIANRHRWDCYSPRCPRTSARGRPANPASPGPRGSLRRRTRRARSCGFQLDEGDLGAALQDPRSLSEYSSLIAVSLWYQRNYSNLAQIP